MATRAMHVAVHDFFFRRRAHFHPFAVETQTDSGQRMVAVGDDLAFGDVGDRVDHRFVVVAVDEVQALASGCSIDKSVGFIKQLEMDLNLMLTDRMVVVFERDGAIHSTRLHELPGPVSYTHLTLPTIYSV